MRLTEKQANERADELCRKLNEAVGGRWKAKVFENIGWHYRAVLGSMQVTERKNLKGDGYSYHCMISEKVGRYGATPAHWSNNYYGDDLEKAVGEALNVLKQEVRKTTNIHNLNVLELID